MNLILPGATGPFNEIAERNAAKAYARSVQAQSDEYIKFMGGMGHLMAHANWANFERGARSSTNIEDFRGRADEDTASGHRSFNAPQDRANVDGALRNQPAINSTGQLDVSVRAPRAHACKGGGRRYLRENKCAAEYSK